MDVYGSLFEELVVVVSIVLLKTSIYISLSTYFVVSINHDFVVTTKVDNRAWVDVLLEFRLECLS